tara:strand:- start:222 stop:764 length:543 start_codon:yes stop_codon:yes gene_type:complete
MAKWKRSIQKRVDSLRGKNAANKASEKADKQLERQYEMQQGLASQQAGFAQEAFDREAGLMRSMGQEASDQYQQAMGDFDTSTTGTPQAVSRLQQMIREQALPEQQRAMSQGNIARQQQGVRGIDSAVMAQQQSNALNKQLANRAESVALQQQLSDREARQKMASGRASQTLGKSLGRSV